MKLKTAIDGFNLSCLAGGFSPNTMVGYNWALNNLAAYLTDPNIEEITPLDIKRFFHHLHTECDYASASIQSAWKAIRSFYNWASGEFNITRPDADLPMPAFSHKEIAPYSAEEVRALLKACDYTSPARTGNRKQFRMKRPTINRDKALILVLLDTGSRVSEICRLNIKDVDLKTGDVKIIPFMSGKKSRSRVVYLGTRSRQAVWRYLSDRAAWPDDPLFATQYGGRMNRDSIRKVLQGLGRRAGVRNVHAHRFRHTFAIQYLRNGGDVFTLQRLLGHSTLDMVRRYLALADADAAEAHRKASPVDNWQGNI